MRILEITLDGMGCFSGNGGSMDFDSDRVVVFGPNEAGKSTLMRSISALIFGFDSKPEEDRWKPWGGCPRFGGRIRFEVNGKQYELDREWGGDMVKLTRNGDVIFEEDFNPRSQKAEPFRSAISQILPLSESVMFHRLSFIQQEELATKVSEDLRQRITGSGRRDALEILEQLHQKYNELTWDKPPWGTRKLHNPRVIETATSQLRELRQQRSDAVEAAQHGSTVEKKLTEIDIQIAEANGAITTTKQVLDRLEHFSGTLADLDNAQKEMTRISQELDRVNTLAANAQSLKAELHETYFDIQDMPADTLELLHSFTTRDEQKAELVSQVTSLEKDIGKWKSKRIVRWFHFAVPLMLGMIVVGGIGYGIGQLILGGLIGLVLGFVGAILWTMRLRKGKDSQVRNLEQRLLVLQQKAAGITMELATLQDQLRPILKNRQPEEAFEHWKSYQIYQGRQREAQAALEGNRELQDIKSDHQQAQLDYTRILERIDEAIGSHPYLAPFRDNLGQLAEEVERLRLEKNQLDQQQKDWEKQRHDLRIEWERQSAGGILDVESLEGDIQHWELQLKNLHKQKDALLLASECLDEAIDSIRDKHIGVIQERLDDLFQHWTGNKDRTVTLDDLWNPLIIHKLNPKVTPDELSRGTLDQLYLAYRVALSEALSQEVPLPFLLDDPFVHFDPARRELARKAFEAISQRHQVILFTQDPGFKDWGKVVRL